MRYPAIDFHQFDSTDPDDELILFAAPADVLASWAGIPRKGWNIRLLYQRWLTESRKQAVTAFWDEAGEPHETRVRKYELGPTALTVALFGDADIDPTGILLDYTCPFPLSDSLNQQLAAASRFVVENRFRQRLTQDEIAVLDSEPFEDVDIDGTNYALESLVQLRDLTADPERFRDREGMQDLAAQELLRSLEGLCRPALVVDGQHRLYGAAHSKHDVIRLPVVAIPNCPWVDQIYQFIVINETAQKVNKDLMTDIFGSSLSPGEQSELRGMLGRHNISVDERIMAVRVGREDGSPFYGMVRVTIEGRPMGFIPESTIRDLAEGKANLVKGWRTDEEFYQEFVEPTFPTRSDWDSHAEGAWEQYWLEFWRGVASHYNAEAKGNGPLWGEEITNLTKTVALRCLQKVFMDKVVATARAKAAAAADIEAQLRKTGTGEKEIETVLENMRFVLPDTVEEFRTKIVDEWFLSNGIPVRLYTSRWRGEIDTTAGHADLYAEMIKAWDLSQPGVRTRYRISDQFNMGNQGQDGNPG